MAKDTVRFKKLDPAAVVPSPAGNGGAGLDLTVIETTIIQAGSIAKCRTGLAVALPSGTFGLIQPRSSSYLAGLAIDGVIDADYRGELVVMIRNLNTDYVKIEAGRRYAQMLVLPFVWSPIEVVSELDETLRGDAGFGSTGR